MGSGRVLCAGFFLTFFRVIWQCQGQHSRTAVHRKVSSILSRVQHFESGPLLKPLVGMGFAWARDRGLGLDWRCPVGSKELVGGALAACLRIRKGVV